MPRFRFGPPRIETPAFTIGDGLITLGLATLLYIGARLALGSPLVVAGPEVSLSPSALPGYALMSVGRMTSAYLLSLLFSLAYGYAAARKRAARAVLMPMLDVLQSVPILSFLPIVLLSLSAVLPQVVAAEIASVVLIFTSQAWNMTFSVYQSMSTIPTELREASAVFRLSPWQRFRTLELPFAAIGLLWNSMMSWAGGWFFLMAAEIFHVGDRDFRLPGLGSYLQTAADAGNIPAVLLGVGTLIGIIVMLDQLVWRPLIAWTDKFKVEMAEADEPPESWFLDALRQSWLLAQFRSKVLAPALGRLERRGPPRRERQVEAIEPASGTARFSPAVIGIGVLFAAGVVYGGTQAARLLATLPIQAFGQLALGLLATFARVAIALAIALAWTIPVGVLIGTNRRMAAVLQPIVQVVASIPATALFPILLLALLRAPGGLNVAAVALMLMGTQWYLLFNIIAGASAIPQDLKYTTALLRLSRLDRWRTLILPALFPYIITGAITASGGAWNASIVAEFVEFGGETHATIGVGALISQATAAANYPMLLAATLCMVLTVVAINRTVWRRLYALAEERFRME